MKKNLGTFNHQSFVTIISQIFLDNLKITFPFIFPQSLISV